MEITLGTIISIIIAILVVGIVWYKETKRPKTKIKIKTNDDLIKEYGEYSRIGLLCKKEWE